MARWILPQSIVNMNTIVNLGLSGNVLIQQSVVLETTAGPGAILGEGSDHQALVFGSVDGYGIGIKLGDDQAADHGNSIYVAPNALVSSYAYAVWLEGYNSSVVNDGTIGSSTTAIAVRIAGSNATTVSTVINNGVIEGSLGILGAVDEKTIVINTGTISADYYALSAGNLDDLVTNNGQMTGAIYLGDGNDIYRGQRGTADGYIFGDSGDDRIYCGVGDNTINGSYGTDIIRGGQGADTMDGGEGLFDMLDYRSSAAGIEIDLAAGTASGGDAQGDIFTGFEKVAGTEFADRITGDYHNNTLAGYSGDDVIAGGDGDDILRGGFGIDRLAGGRGADKLQGDGDADFFQFKNRADTTVSKSGRDTILDFGVGDKIDISGIDANTIVDGNQTFSFIGTGAFSGRNAEVRYEKKASDTFIYGDVNGDGKADFAIHLDDAVTLQSGDFVL